MSQPQSVIELDPHVLGVARELPLVRSFDELSSLLEVNEVALGSYWRQSNQQVAQKLTKGAPIPDDVLVALVSDRAVFDMLSERYEVRGYHAVNQDATRTLEPSARRSSRTRKGSERNVRPPLPGVPSNLKAAAVSSTQIDLSWTAAPGPVETYRVERSTSPDRGFTEVSAVPGTQSECTELAPGTRYYFRVRACNDAGGCSPYSDTASATTQSPGAKSATEESTATSAIAWSQVESEVDLFEPASNLIRLAATQVAQATRPRPLTSGVLLINISDRGRPDGESRWAADFLIRELQRNGLTHYNDVRTRFFAELSMPSDIAATPFESPVLEELLFETLKVAGRLAVDTTGQSLVHTRHLLAALLLEEEGEARYVIQRLGLEPAVLRDRMLGFMLGWGDNDDAWERILSPSGPTHQRLITYHADDARGSDLIGISREVIAMATLITARDIRPPLSIGLFGEWGSGKTFFMRQLRTAIAAMSAEARTSKRMQRDLPFYKRIVQIEFNAWHYVEGNLWASLVEHVFRNLRIEEDEEETVTQSLQKNLLAKIGFQQATLQAATAEEEAAKAAVLKAELELQEAEKRREQKRQELTSLQAVNIKRQFDLPGIQAQLQPLLAAMGIDKVGTAATDLLHAMKRAETVLQQGGGVLTPLLHAPDRNLRWAKLAASVLVPSALGVTVTWFLRNWDFAPFASVMATLAAVGGTLTAWIKRQTEWVDAKVQRIHAIQRDYDEQLTTLLQQNDEQIAELQMELRDLNAERDRKLNSRVDAEKALQTVQDELKSATSVKLLADFIVDRAESTDYRKHLGVLALVRDDFEKLSGLIDDENWKLAPPLPGEKERTGIKKFETLEEEAKEEDSRINRIVLYIDDLDRCPPNKVVEVLQAVHLLLAFPLFVVVVGVDARWVKRSLRTRYRELLHAEEREEEDEELAMIGRATADDYLEKIFQVPYWLEPMDVNGCRRMVSGLVRSSLKQDTRKPEPAKQNGQTVTNAQSVQPPIGSTPRLETTPLNAQGQQQVREVLEPTQKAAPAVAIVPPEAPAHQPNIDSLEISADEIQFMSELAPVLGRSPRALKRFVNVYRLVKAGLSQAEYSHFLAPDFGPYQIVLLLLAIDTGTPLAVPTVYNALARQRQDTSTGDASWLVSALEIAATEPGSRANAERIRLRDWIAERANASYLTNADHIARWAERIARYSFGAEALELLRNTTPSAE